MGKSRITKQLQQKMAATSPPRIVISATSSRYGGGGIGAGEMGLGGCDGGDAGGGGDMGGVKQFSVANLPPFLRTGVQGR